MLTKFVIIQSYKLTSLLVSIFVHLPGLQNLIIALETRNITTVGWNLITWTFLSCVWNVNCTFYHFLNDKNVVFAWDNLKLPGILTKGGMNSSLSRAVSAVLLCFITSPGFCYEMPAIVGKVSIYPHSFTLYFWYILTLVTSSLLLHISPVGIDPHSYWVF